MAKVYYYSIYSEKIQEYVEMKRKLGYKFVTGEQYLRILDRYISYKALNKIGFTKTFADDWALKLPNETESQRCIRISTLLNFSSYLQNIGIDSYLPKLPPMPKPNFTPFIFSNSEMDSLFKISNKLISGHNTSMSTCIMAFPAILRVLCGTGIRISEVLNILLTDVNLTESYIKIKNIKNKKERIIPVSDSLIEVLNTYINYRNKIMADYSSTTYLFIKPDGQRCTAIGVRRWFKICLKLAKINCHQSTREPRIHDLRHTFAVNSLAKMASEGIDLYVSMPILSTYLGHQKLESTENYVRLTVNMFPELTKKLEDVTKDVFPKFSNYE